MNDEMTFTTNTPSAPMTVSLNDGNWVLECEEQIVASGYRDERGWHVERMNGMFAKLPPFPDFWDLINHLQHS